MKFDLSDLAAAIDAFMFAVFMIAVGVNVTDWRYWALFLLNVVKFAIVKQLVKKYALSLLREELKR